MLTLSFSSDPAVFLVTVNTYGFPSRRIMASDERTTAFLIDSVMRRTFANIPARILGSEGVTLSFTSIVRLVVSRTGETSKTFALNSTPGYASKETTAP